MNTLHLKTTQKSLKQSLWGPYALSNNRCEAQCAHGHRVFNFLFVSSVYDKHVLPDINQLGTVTNQHSHSCVCF